MQPSCQICKHVYFPAVSLHKISREKVKIPLRLVYYRLDIFSFTLRYPIYGIGRIEFGWF